MPQIDVAKILKRFTERIEQLLHEKEVTLRDK